MDSPLSTTQARRRSYLGQPFPGDEAGGVSLYATWQSRHARWIETDLLASSPEVSHDDEDDTTMDTGFDETDLAPTPPVHSEYTMSQAHAQYSARMTEG
ncbi:hypothetical protein D1007_25639 [Hordeum vulgare]|nr:hypothetical protein D1007_25639 [Hordeum vulgare]